MQSEVGSRGESVLPGRFSIFMPKRANCMRRNVNMAGQSCRLERVLLSVCSADGEKRWVREKFENHLAILLSLHVPSKPKVGE